MIWQGIPDFTSTDEAVAWCHAEIDRFRAAGYPQRRKLYHTPAGATAADRFCRVCRGLGHLTDIHAYGEPTVCECHRCGGAGFLT